MARISYLGPRAAAQPHKRLRLNHQPQQKPAKLISAASTRVHHGLNLLCNATARVLDEEDASADLTGRLTPQTVLFLLMHAVAFGFDSSGRTYVDVRSVRTSAGAFVTALNKALEDENANKKAPTESKLRPPWHPVNASVLAEKGVLHCDDVTRQRFILKTGARFRTLRAPPRPRELHLAHDAPSHLFDEEHVDSHAADLDALLLLTTTSSAPSAPHASPSAPQLAAKRQ